MIPRDYNWPSRDDIRRIEEATDLVELVGEHVELQACGHGMIGCCPFCRSGVLSLVVTSEGYRCHRCGAHGNCLSYMVNMNNMGFRESFNALAERAGLDELKGNW